MEIRELRAFVAVVEEGGLSAAARRVHASQSALSQTVRSLERQLGVRLLVRDHTGARPTESGRVLLGAARELIAHHDRVLSAVAAPSAAGRAHLRVGVPPEFPVDLLPGALTRLAAEHPDTKVELLHSSSAAQLSALRAGELDVALVRDRPADARLDAVLAEGMVWHPLIGHPIVRRTWAVWRACARERDLAALISILDTTG